MYEGFMIEIFDVTTLDEIYEKALVMRRSTVRICSPAPETARVQEIFSRTLFL